MGKPQPHVPNRAQQMLQEYVARQREKRYTMGEIAESLRVSVMSLRHYLAGRRRPSGRAALVIEVLTSIPIRCWYEEPLHKRVLGGAGDQETDQ